LVKPTVLFLKSLNIAFSRNSFTKCHFLSKTTLSLVNFLRVIFTCPRPVSPKNPPMLKSDFMTR
jgi:hypothetical protein